jgi:RNA ligase (TIGR02306 family)
MVESTTEVTNDLENLQIKRKLASVQTMSELLPIDSDQSLEIAKVLGWQVVVEKGVYKVGDLIIYFEIDSQLPEDRWCEDMQFYDYRVTTTTIAGVISQGFIRPINTLKNHENYKVGDDVTETLDVTKYDEEEKTTSRVDAGEFPMHLIPFTDEPRVQSEPKYLDVFAGKAYVASIKYDGTSGTYLLNPDDTDELWVCSRNKIVDPKKKNDYWQIAETYKIKEKLQKYPDYAVQGEVYGPGIQKIYLELNRKCLLFLMFILSRKKDV